MLALVSSVADRTTSAVSELGHWRLPSLESPLRPGSCGPTAGACVCWHDADAHELCEAKGCECGGEFHMPFVYGWLTLGLALLRGGR